MRETARDNTVTFNLLLFLFIFLPEIHANMNYCLVKDGPDFLFLSSLFVFGVAPRYDDRRLFTNLQSKAGRWKHGNLQRWPIAARECVDESRWMMRVDTKLRRFFSS